MQRFSASASSTDGVMNHLDGMNVFGSGAFYILNGGPSAYVSSTTETSLFTGETPVTIGQPPNQSTYGSTRYFGPSILNQGSMFNIDLFGTIGNTGTPNVTFRLGFVDTSNTFNVLATTGVVATSAITGTALMHIYGGINVVSVGSAGSVNAFIGIEYAPTLISIFSPLTTTSIDLTKIYKLDILATWGTSNSSNTMVLKYGAIELVG